MEKWERPVIIMGATGLVGRNLLYWARQTFQNSRVIGTYCHHSKPQLVAFNLLTDSFNQLTRERGGLLFFCAGISKTEEVYKNDSQARAINFEGTTRCLRQATEAGWFPIYLSSDKVYGSKDTPFKETDTCHPTTRYGELKRLVEEWMNQQGNSHLILRLSKVFSATCEAGNPIAQVYQSLKQGTRLKGVTDQSLNPIHVRDIINGIQSLLMKDQTGTWNLGGPETLTRFDMANLIRKRFHFSPSLLEPVYLEELGLSEIHPNNCVISTSKIGSLLTEPLVSFSKTCHDFVAT